MTTTKSLEEIQNFEGKYPKQIWSLFFCEMWERFSFYGMRGMLVFFMIDQLMMSEKDANLQYGATQAWVYSFTFIGGLLADKILGYRKSLFWGSIIMIIGSIVLAMDPHKYFILGIACNIVGSGFFKPNISTIVGALYKKGDSRRDAGFSLFYSGINLGATLGGYLCVAIGKGQLFADSIPHDMRWNVAFGLAAIVMTISLITFILTRHQLGPIGLIQVKPEESQGFISKNRKWIEYGVYGLTLLWIPIVMIMVANTQYTDWFMYAIGPISILILIYEMRKLNAEANKKLIAAMFFIFFSVLFWAIFEQAGGSLSIFAANNLNNDLLGIFNLERNGVNNSANAVFIILFAPILGLLWIALSKRNLEPNSVVKFGLGFLFLGVAFYLFYLIRFVAGPDGVANLNLFTFAYFVVTLGELCLSPIGLSVMTKLAPQKLQAFMMGMWFLASAYGQYVAGLFGAGIAGNMDTADNYTKLLTYTDGYKTFAWYAIIAGVILIIISPGIRKLMGDEK